MEPIVLVKNGKERVVHTPTERVQLESEGYVEQSAPEPEPAPEPVIPKVPALNSFINSDPVTD